MLLFVETFNGLSDRLGSQAIDLEPGECIHITVEVNGHDETVAIVTAIAPTSETVDLVDPTRRLRKNASYLQ